MYANEQGGAWGEEISVEAAPGSGRSWQRSVTGEGKREQVSWNVMRLWRRNFRGQGQADRCAVLRPRGKKVTLKDRESPNGETKLLGRGKGQGGITSPSIPHWEARGSFDLSFQWSVEVMEDNISGITKTLKAGSSGSRLEPRRKRPAQKGTQI